MTRAEYQAKYGQAPSIPSTPAPQQTAPIQMTHAEYMAKYGPPPQTEATPPATNPMTGQPIPTFGTDFNTIKSAASAGIEKAKSGYNEIQTATNPLQLLEGAAKQGAGAIETASSPLAPLFSPIGKLIGYVSDKIASHPAVQAFANSAAGNATSRIAENVGNLNEIAGAVSGGNTKISAPVEGALNTAVSKTADAAGTVSSQVLGATTGTGAASVKGAFNGGQAFVDAMRGKITPEEIVATAKGAVENIATNRRTAYQNQLATIKNGQPFKHDFTPITEAADKTLTNFGVTRDETGSLNFDNSTFGSTADQNKITQIITDIKKWQSDPSKQTTIGLDTLKQRIGNYITPDTKIGAFATQIKNVVTSELNKAPGYKDLTSGYAKASNLLDDIQSATTIGGKAKVDTVFTKLTTALKGDKELRLQMLKEMQAQGAQPDLMGQISGINMSSVIPRGLVGKGADVGAAFAVLGHYFNPQYIPMILATSPRVVGEFVHVLGMGKDAVSAITHAINKYGAKAITGPAVATPLSSQPQAPKQSNSPEIPTSPQPTSFGQKINEDGTISMKSPFNDSQITLDPTMGALGMEKVGAAKLAKGMAPIAESIVQQAKNAPVIFERIGAFLRSHPLQQIFSGEHDEFLKRLGLEKVSPDNIIAILNKVMMEDK